MGGRPGIPEEPRKLLKTQVGQEWGWLFSEEPDIRIELPNEPDIRPIDLPNTLGARSIDLPNEIGWPGVGHPRE
jgi:hypothetical protein